MRVKALVADLKQLGLLYDDGRSAWADACRSSRTMPVALPGRDHNTYGFSHWYAGGASRPGTFTEPPTNGATTRSRQTVTIRHSRYEAVRIDDKELTYQRPLGSH